MGEAVPARLSVAQAVPQDGLSHRSMSPVSGTERSSTFTASCWQLPGDAPEQPAAPWQESALAARAAPPVLIDSPVMSIADRAVPAIFLSHIGGNVRRGPVAAIVQFDSLTGHRPVRSPAG